MKSIVVLSHLMTKNGIPGNETKSRANLAIRLFNTDKFNYLITSGWAYRNDCDYRICDVVKEYILKSSEINSNKIKVLPHSRDTVGDAFFSLKFVKEVGIKKLIVITSDYHVLRSRLIFKKFFRNIADLEIMGINSELKNNKDIVKKELKSTEVFMETFKNADFSNLNSIYQCLLNNHPLYNGKVYPQFLDIRN